MQLIISLSDPPPPQILVAHAEYFPSQQPQNLLINFIINSEV